MEHQYPGPISSDEGMLAELMLPDQTHVRSQDWTIFFLHKDTGAEGEEDDLARENNKRKGKRSRVRSSGDEGASADTNNDSEVTEEEESSDEEDGGEGPPLMYVLNLVNTKQDNTVKRYVSCQHVL
jgi:hypothetical protein